MPINKSSRLFLWCGDPLVNNPFGITLCEVCILYNICTIHITLICNNALLHVQKIFLSSHPSGAHSLSAQLLFCPGEQMPPSRERESRTATFLISHLFPSFLLQFCSTFSLCLSPPSLFEVSFDGVGPTCLSPANSPPSRLPRTHPEDTDENGEPFPGLGLCGKHCSYRVAYHQGNGQYVSDSVMYIS